MDGLSLLSHPHFAPALKLPPARGSGAPAVSALSGQISGSPEAEEHGGGGKRPREDSTAAGDEPSKLVSTSSGSDSRDCDVKRLKVTGFREENGSPEMNTEEDLHIQNKLADQVQSCKETKQDYIHVRARRGQATDRHSLAERARRERIGERMKILQDLIPGCNKVIGKASILDEIINYIQSLQQQVEFLSMKLEAVSSRINSRIESLLSKDLHKQSFEAASSLGYGSQATREYGQGSVPDWLHMQVGSPSERAT